MSIFYIGIHLQIVKDHIITGCGTEIILHEETPDALFKLILRFTETPLEIKIYEFMPLSICLADLSGGRIRGFVG